MLLNVKFALAAVLLLAVGTDAQGGCPRGVQTRREFRMLSHTERITYLSALRQLQSQPRPNVYDNYVSDHVAATTTAHGVPRFFSWHRAFLRDLEKKLQAINPSITLPYWDWAYDSQAPEASLLFTDAYYGGNGDPNSNYRVTKGYFSSWQPRNGLNFLQRRFGGGNRIPALWSWEALRSYVFSKTTYDQFRIAAEGPHGNVHNGIGAQFSSMRSPDDPIFWLHHSFVDYLWFYWQNLSSSNFYSYGGTNHDGTPARTTDNLGYGYRVQDVFDTRKLCYTYEPYRGGVAIPQPPASTPPPKTAAPTPTPTPSAGSSSSPPASKPTGGAVVPPTTNGTVPTGGTKVNVTVPGVGVQPAQNVSNYKPKYDDRSNIINLRPPPPLPEAWCRLNNLKVEDVRKGEAAAEKTLEQINHLPGYISPSALVNHDDVLKKLAQEGQKFIGYIGDKKIDIPYDGASPASVAKTVQTKVAAVCTQVYKQVSFVYPRVLENIYKSVPVYKGGQSKVPALPGAGNNDSGNDNSGKDNSGHDVYDDDEEDCEEDEYPSAPPSGGAPSGNDTYGAPAPPSGGAPSGNDTYGAPAPPSGGAPSGNDTYGAPAPPSGGAPSGNDTYGAPAPPSGAKPSGNDTYGAPAPPTYGAPSPSGNDTYGGQIPSGGAKPCNKTGGQIPSGNDTYGGQVPSGNTTYGAPTPPSGGKPSGNDTYGGQVPSGNTTYGAPSPSGNDTYGGAKPCNKTGGQLPSGNTTYGAPVPSGNDTYGTPPPPSYGAPAPTSAPAPSYGGAAPAPAAGY